MIQHHVHMLHTLTHSYTHCKHVESRLSAEWKYSWGLLVHVHIIMCSQHPCFIHPYSCSYLVTLYSLFCLQVELWFVDWMCALLYCYLGNPFAYLVHICSLCMYVKCKHTQILLNSVHAVFCIQQDVHIFAGSNFMESQQRLPKQNFTSIRLIDLQFTFFNLHLLVDLFLAYSYQCYVCILELVSQLVL